MCVVCVCDRFEVKCTMRDGLQFTRRGGCCHSSVFGRRGLFFFVVCGLLLSDGGIWGEGGQPRWMGVSAEKLRPWYAWPDINSYNRNNPKEPMHMYTVIKVGDESLWVFGGEMAESTSSGLYKLDVVSKMWTKFDVGQNVWPTARSAHAAAAIGDDFLVFGGSSQGQIGPEQGGELWKFATQTLTWKLLDVTGDNKPASKTAHAMTAVRNSIYMFGGKTMNLRSDELWMISMEDLSWHRLNLPDWNNTKPSARSGHAMTNVGEYVYLHGGQTGHGPDLSGQVQDYSTDLWRYDTLRRVWALLAPLDASTQPSGRIAHAIVAFGPYIYIHGGWALAGDDSPQALSDLWQFNIYSREWVLLNSTLGVTRPSARGYHGMALLGTDIYLLSGSTVMMPKVQYSGELWKLSIPEVANVKFCDDPDGLTHRDPNPPHDMLMCCDLPNGRYGYGSFPDVTMVS